MSIYKFKKFGTSLRIKDKDTVICLNHKVLNGKLPKLFNLNQEDEDAGDAYLGTQL